MDEKRERRVLHVLDSKGRERIALAYPNDPSARQILERIFTCKEYGIPDFVARHLRRLASPVIVDVGANVGGAAVFFASCFPNAQIYCFEPAPDSFEFLKENIAGRAEITAFSYGLFSQDCELLLYPGIKGGVCNSVVQNALTTGSGVPVRLARASDALARLNIDYISLLKIDTEGCEVPILQDLGGLLSRTDLIYVEYHSESDRRTIDALLAPTFKLFHAHADVVHRGVCGYVATSLTTELPEMDEYEIQIPNNLLRI